MIDQENYRLLSHTTELIVLNGNRGLKRLAEEGNESLHSIQRKTREQVARKFNLAAGDEDTFRFISNNTQNDTGATTFKLRHYDLVTPILSRTCFTN